MLVLAIFFTPFTTPKSAQALTFEEGVRLWGVLNRYLEDLQKNLPNRTNTIPTTEPQLPKMPIELQLPG